MLVLSVQVIRLPGVLSQTPLQAWGAAIVQTAMIVPSVLYEVNFQFLSPHRAHAVHHHEAELLRVGEGVDDRARRRQVGVRVEPAPGRRQRRVQVVAAVAGHEGRRVVAGEIQRLEVVHVTVDGDPDVRRVVVDGAAVPGKAAFMTDWSPGLPIVGGLAAE